MIKFILITILAFATINSKCSDGCLQCKNKICRLCDSSTNYILQQGECQQKDLPNCEVQNNTGNCLVCQEPYHLDLSIKKCIQISDNNLIPNCQSYSGPNSCHFCKKDFYFNSGVCEQIGSPISNCDLENGKALCEICSPGFIRSIDQKTCLESPGVDNCSTYTNIKCEECSSGFLSNKNSYLESIFTFLTVGSRDLFNMRVYDLERGVVDMKKYKECQSLTISNCLQYLDFNKCKKCAFGFFVNDLGFCESYPVDSIPFCKEYGSLVNCKECISGYWINELGFCFPVKDVENCIGYSKKVGHMNCVKCNESYYLGDDNQCILRKYEFITNCSVMSDTSETCEECVLNYRNTSDRKKCLSIITNCQEYVPSNFLTENFSCRLCEENYYFDQEEQFCKKGTIVNCRIYQENQNICEKCVNKFYLENSQCLPHDILFNCEIYHPTRRNVCKDCNSSTFLFNKRNDCLKISPQILNCRKFETKDKCSQCEHGYRLTDSSECVEIDPALNCVQMIKNQCEICLENFVLQNGICYDPVDFFVNECETHNYDGTHNYDQSKCFTCKVNTVPFNYKDSFICVENDYMTMIKDVSLDSNCLQYIGTLDGVYSCTRCSFPYFLDDGNCVSDCGAKTLYKQILETFNSDGDRLNESYSISRINVCGDKIENCKIAAPDINQSNPQKASYVCIECDPGKIPEIEFNNSKVLISDPNTKEFQFGKSPVSFSLPVKCYSNVDIFNKNEVLGDVNETTKLIDNCQFYLDLGLKKGCTKCEHGYTGVVIDIVHNCEVYLNDQYTCKTCKQGYFLKSVYECTQVEDLEECTEYETQINMTKCKTCSETYYVTFDGTCQKRSNSLSITNCTSISDIDECNCNPGFFNSKILPDIFCDSLPTNCLEADIINDVIKCTTCDDTVSFIDPVEGICKPGVQQNCLRFDNNKCVECDFQYYIVDGNCIQHLPITLCTEYDQDSKNTCSKCEKDSIVFTVEKICKEVVAIQYCEKWSSIEYCEKCESGKRRTNFDRKCGTIPPTSNCAVQTPMDIDISGVIDQLDQTINNGVDELIYTCDECLSGFIRIPETFTFINPDNGNHHNTVFTKYVCVEHWKYTKQYCDSHNINGLIGYVNTIKCNYCSEDFYEEDFENNAICIDKDYIKTKVVGNTVDPNCLRYNNVGNIYQCNLCRFPYNLQSDFSCAETCLEVESTNYNYIDFSVNKWVETYANGSCNNISSSTSETCEVKTKLYLEDIAPTFSMNISSDFYTAEEICMRCKDTHKISVINFNNNDFYKLHGPIDGMHLSSEKVIRDPVSAFPAFTDCIKYDNTHANIQNELLGSFSLATKEVPFCDYYILIQTNTATATTLNRYGCARCKLGYTGILESPPGPSDPAVSTDYTNEINQNGYIKECSVMVDCDMTSSLNNINTYGAGLIVEGRNEGNFLNSLFSCYKCETLGSIPVVAIPFSNAVESHSWKLYGYEKFDPINGNESNFADLSFQEAKVFENDGPPIYGTQTSCVGFFDVTDSENHVPLSTSTNIVIANPNIDVNCALAIVNTLEDGDGTNAALEDTFDSKLVCVACNPGYKAIRFTFDLINGIFTGPVWGVISCEKIIAADSIIDGDGNRVIVDVPCSDKTPNTWFNFCETCIHFYDIYTNKIHYDKCSPPDEVKTIENCFASYDIGPCVICRKGYLRKSNGICEKITIPRCNSPFYRSNLSNLKTEFIQNNHRTMSYLLDDFANDGCSVCSDSTKEVLTILTNDEIDLPKRFCTNLALGDRPSIDNCMKYNWDEDLTNYLCKVCDTDFILTLDGKCTAVSSAKLNFCLIANEINGDSCIECAANYLNVAGVCILITDLDSNCKTFDPNSKDLPYAICEECVLGYYLDKDNTVCAPIDTIIYPNCNQFDKVIQKCTGCISDFMLIKHSNSSECVSISTIPGFPDFDSNCAEIDQNEFNLNKLVCKKCNIAPSNYIPTINNITLKSHCIKISTEGTQSQKDLCKTYDILYEDDTEMWDNKSFKCKECLDETTQYFDELTNLCNLRNLIGQCVSYNPLKNKCIECADNYVLNVNGLFCEPLPGGLNPSLEVNKGYLQNCKAMLTCASKVIYEGLHPHFSALFSCHACLDPSKIPVVAVRNEENKLKVVSLQEYGIHNQLGYNYLSGKEATSVQCLPQTHTAFNIPENQWTFPQNCGAAIINSEKSLYNLDSILDNLLSPFSDIAVYCAACKPGFKPTYTNYVKFNFQNPPTIQTHEYLINSCDAITACESSVWFNYCSQCDPDHSYLYDVEKGVQYNVCVLYSENPDCFSVDNSDPSNMKCVFCRKGSYKNPDGICESLNPPRCSLTNFGFRFNYLISDLNSGLYLSRYGIGCHKCDEGFVGMYTHQEDVVSCTLSSYHKNSKVLIDSKYIFKCLNYKVSRNGKFLCDQCDSGFVLTIDGTCVIKDSIENCELAFNKDFCKKCLPGYVVIDRACVEVEIENCEYYGNNAQSFSQICIECKKEFYLLDNTCVKGEIKNCEIYLEKENCEKCREGFGLVQNKDEKYYCYPMNKEYRCKNLSYNQLQGGVLECRECEKDNIVSYNESEYIQTSCINFDNVKHCAKYDKNDSIALSSYICLECDTNYFLDNGNCFPRLVNSTKCLKYNLTEDKCLECEEGNFLNADGTFCVKFPEGIPNCLIYLSQKECLTCKSEFYLKDQICYPIKEENKIENCLLYEDEQICSSCGPGYLIIEGQCFLAIAKDCGEWKTVSSCETCRDNSFGFKLENGILNCMQKPEQNCKESEDYEPYKCLVCDPDFYVNNDECTAVINKIISCEIYETETICSKCEKGAALSQDKLSCIKSPSVIQNLDFNCDNSQLIETPMCNTCKPGHYFSHGFCISCNKNTLEDGCYNCDPANQDRCLICLSGYFMYDSGKCYKNGEIPPEEKEKGEGEGSEGEGNGGKNEGEGNGGGDGGVDGGDGKGTDSGAELVMDNLMKMIVFFGLVFLN